MLDSLTSFGQLLLVVIGFGSVIFIHEMGHFLAAKWAGIRVHEFAIGFGKPMCAWRKGVGFRFGSTRPISSNGAILEDEHGQTEYRLNWLPFGGYVKMLGQDDLKPSESSSPDSYTQKPVWKRMVVVSAGVVMNLILAAVLFVIVFMVGLPAPAPTIGAVEQDSPAALATPVSDTSIGHGLLPGDEVVNIDGRRAMSFADLSLAAAMAKQGQPISITVEREGVAQPIEFTMVPRLNKDTDLLELGVGSALANTIVDQPEEALEKVLYAAELEEAGIAQLPENSKLVSVDGQPTNLAGALIDAFIDGNGRPVTYEFESPDGARTKITRTPSPSLETATIETGPSAGRTVNHLLGLRPAAVVGICSEHASAQGLRRGDVIAKAGSSVWPNINQTMAAISGSAGKTVPVRVLRDGAYTDLDVQVQKDGRVGMYFESDVARIPAIAVRMPQTIESIEQVIPELTPGTRIVSIDGSPVASFAELRAALRDRPIGDVAMIVQLPIGPDPAAAPTEPIAFTLTEVAHDRIAALGWQSPINPMLFQMKMTELKASGPIDALVMGVSETHRYVMMTYLTFVRLAQGSVKVEHIKGPVGIAHFGTRVVEQGFLNLLFFLAVISANLAVINFLPLPIVDGGLFVFLVVEGVTRKPVSIAIQNVATLAGIALIGSVFLLVTFNDIKTLLGS